MKPKGKRGALRQALKLERMTNDILRSDRTRLLQTGCRQQDKLMEKDVIIRTLVNQLAATGEELRRAEERACYYERLALDRKPLLNFGTYGQLCLMPSPQTELMRHEA